MPETHLAADYRVEVGDRRHAEPRANRDPNKPHLFMMPHESEETDELSHDDLKRYENLLDWTVKPGEFLLSNRTQEEISLFCRKGQLYHTYRAIRVTTDADGNTRDVPVTSRPVNACLDQFEYDPDIYLLTTVRCSSRSLKLQLTQPLTGNIPTWVTDFQDAVARYGQGVEGRIFQPFDETTPGCWAVATHVVAAHETGNKMWAAKAQEHMLQAAEECWDGRIVGGLVYRGISAFCWRDFQHRLIVALESADHKPLGEAGLTSRHIT